MIAPVVLISAAILAAAYLVYGRFLAGAAGFDSLLSAVFGLILLVLSVFLLAETARVLRRRDA